MAKLSVRGQNGKQWYEQIGNSTPCIIGFLPGRTHEGKVLLEWITASEINNEGFEVQHSDDGLDWKKLSFVDGHGTTTEAQAYSFSHAGFMDGLTTTALSRWILMANTNTPTLCLYPWAADGRASA